MSQNFVNEQPFEATDRMRDLIARAPLLLMTLTRFGISLGFGNMTVEEVCKKQDIDCLTFLAVANFMASRAWSRHGLKLATVMDYLRNAHTYFLDFTLPMIRRKLIEAIDCSDPEGLGFLIIRFYDEYVTEVRLHMWEENSQVFPYVENLLKGETSAEFNIRRFVSHHNHIAPKLQELKDIIVRYYAGKGNDLLNSALFDIITCEHDLHQHCLAEDCMFVPLVEKLEHEVESSIREKGRGKSIGPEKTGATASGSDEVRIAELSAREKEVICLIAKGFSNKEIADKLCLSVHTVTTHRRNISNKLEIHSPAGITIFAIVNHLLPLEEIPRPR